MIRSERDVRPSLLGSQELRSSVVSVLLSLIPGTLSIAGHLVLIVCLNRGCRFKACFVAPTGCPGIAVLPGSAHACHWQVSLCLITAVRSLKLAQTIYYLASSLLFLLLATRKSFIQLNAAEKTPLSTAARRSTYQGKETTSVPLIDWLQAACKRRPNSYLPDEGLHRDHVGGGPRARPDHCTSAGLTPAIIPNVDNSVV